MYDMKAVKSGVEELTEQLETAEITQDVFNGIAHEVVDLLLILVRMDKESPDDNFIDFVEHYMLS